MTGKKKTPAEVRDEQLDVAVGGGKTTVDAGTLRFTSGDETVISPRDPATGLVTGKRSHKP